MAAVNVDKLSLKELIDLEAKVKKALALARDRERTEIKKKVADLAETHGFPSLNCLAERVAGGLVRISP